LPLNSGGGGGQQQKTLQVREWGSKKEGGTRNGGGNQDIQSGLDPAPDGEKAKRGDKQSVLGFVIEKKKTKANSVESCCPVKRGGGGSEQKKGKCWGVCIPSQGNAVGGEKIKAKGRKRGGQFSKGGPPTSLAIVSREKGKGKKRGRNRERIVG